MIPYASLHNHTNFADGKHSPDEMVEAAYRAGFACFGISEHATMDHAPEDGLKVRDMGLYESIMRDLQYHRQRSEKTFSREDDWLFVLSR